MAGDWIKIQHVTPDKPEIYQIASILGVTPEDAFGRCVRVWIWADQQSLNGHALTVTFVTLDSISRHAGFGASLSKVGWLIDNGDGTLTFPNFGQHNGETAKTRAGAKDRQKNSREKKAQIVTEMSQQKRDEAVTREEKRREEVNPSLYTPLPPVESPTRKGVVCGLLRKAGMSDAAPHYLTDEVWATILSKRTDEEIVEVAKAKMALRPNERIGLKYIAKALMDDPQPLVANARASPSGRPINGRQAAIDNYAADAAAARGDSSERNFTNERDITGEACRVA